MARNSFLGGVADFFGDIGRARAASALYNDLSVLSDASLKARGLKRDEIAAYAYKKSFGK
ncbi:hypothetical protein [Pelagibacterium xiamenense]|uniref:hypothetical protein n=1 Tax=Pelagibacterium xiamenense TaxID=2901140 RepID=UPI001E5EAD8A|nr:hypothetical protein [Pelagibacterium xiamenense]MCD7058577.1 hypothetical protein [Pelagibacterium xiamenense]